jgi:nicotinamide mononucleotide transporter
VQGSALATAAEVVAVVLGIVYSVLAVRRSRWCWLAGALSSAIFVVLFARAQLPMQSVLQAYYVAMSAYGFWKWSGEGGDAPRVGVWPLRTHVIVWIGIAALSAVSARVLAAETQAAWPYLDSAVTWASLVATWLVARMKLENWLYWIATDFVLVFLSAAQGLYFTAGLYAIYLVIATVGFFTWRRILRAGSAAAAL